ncbi:MAG: hypothetical protein V3V88_02980 [Dehalococcoidia bacterium]
MSGKVQVWRNPKGQMFVELNVYDKLNEENSGLREENHLNHTKILELAVKKGIAEEENAVMKKLFGVKDGFLNEAKAKLKADAGERAIKDAGELTPEE